MFGFDVAFGDPVVGERDRLPAPNLLDIVDETALLVPLYPIATHLAEKVHAYTLPRKYPNHRLKDLLDLALVAAEVAVEGATLREALHRTFSFRASHPLPGSLPQPPAEWAARYPALKRENELPWPNIDAVYDAAAAFLDPVLEGSAVGTWEPGVQRWR